MRATKTIMLAAALAALLPAVTGHAAAGFDWSAWDGLLARYTSPATVDGVKIMAVDYAGLRAAKKAFGKLLERLRRFEPDTLGGRAKLAFWINAYNVGAVKMVLEHPGIASINDAVPGQGRVWKTPIINIGGRDYSLDEIENSILRPLGEPRIHFAIVCASVSCPDLRRESYRADRLERQLDEQTRGMLKNPGKGLRRERAGGMLYVSKIFEWFAADFGGRAGIRKFIGRYAEKLPRGWRGWPISYLDYDWKLNARPAEP